MEANTLRKHLNYFFRRLEDNANLGGGPSGRPSFSTFSSSTSSGGGGGGNNNLLPHHQKPPPPPPPSRAPPPPNRHGSPAPARAFKPQTTPPPPTAAAAKAAHHQHRQQEVVSIVLGIYIVSPTWLHPTYGSYKGYIYGGQFSLQFLGKWWERGTGEWGGRKIIASSPLSLFSPWSLNHKKSFRKKNGRENKRVKS